MPTSKSRRFNGELLAYGVAADTVRYFDEKASPAQLDYLDLLDTEKLCIAPKLRPDAVAEAQGRPLLFFVSESRLAVSPSEQDTQLNTLRRQLACRGDRAYLAVVRPGELSVTPVSLSARTPAWRNYEAGSAEAVTFFPRLALGHYDGAGEPAHADFVFVEMFNLLEQSADRLARHTKRPDVLSLVGRALFFRFLRDRQVVTETDRPRIAPKAGELLAAFDTAENAAATSRWLDRTFNGDFLPLSDNSTGFFEDLGRRTGGRVFSYLRAIVRGEEPTGTDDYQQRLQLTWGDFDFAHVPVGLLSQVYEKFAWKWEHREAKETSVHYTPRHIAATLVDEAFERLPKPHAARVLDPASGAGVFLVLAFRRLYRERWQHTGHRPDTRAIREILEDQITGFDISDSALKLAALSLYLTAIELDPDPVPPEKLKFKQLRDAVLFNFRRPDLDPSDRPVIGSLGAHVGARFDGQFDLVLSNPPWTSLGSKEKKLAGELESVSREIISRKDGPLANGYENPDNGPDLPFVWRSTEWCKPAGHIAMALPARILLKQEPVPRRARETLFRLVEVTGIINGSNLSDTKVWPGMMQPFMLFFIRNRRPRPGHLLRLITPYCDTVLNQKGEVRLDSKSTQSVEVETSFDEPWLWKALAVGTELDIEIVRKIKNSTGRPLNTYWRRDLKLASGKGYRIAETQEQQPARFLRNLPNLDSTDRFHFVVEAHQLAPFLHSSASRPREEPIYEAPLVLIKEAPGIDRTQGWALLSLAKIAYNESFCGYSAAGHPEGELLVRYLQLFAHSSIWLHYALLTSAKFGAERRRFYKADLDECPIVPLAALTVEQRRAIAGLSRRLIAEDSTIFEEIDAFFAQLYGLGRLDSEVIRDTLEVCLPYDESRERACNPPSLAEREAFRRRLESVLRPFFKALGKEAEVVAWHSDAGSLTPFGVLLIREKNRPSSDPARLFRERILPLANQTGASRIIFEAEAGLVVGVLAQYRYWTPSRARLLGAEIIRRHMRVFEEST